MSFPIVGIGASAGGLEALEEFLGHVPASSGMAFVIVQHLDPTHKGVMPELLQRATGMKVMQVKDRTRVRPNCVYVIPPNKDMSILHGVLHLLEPAAPRGLRLPIDFFLRTLAQDQQEHSIGVILSGMGSDGTLGLRAIKEKAGVVLVQEPATAKFDSMPRSAVDAGLADIVAADNHGDDRMIGTAYRFLCEAGAASQADLLARRRSVDIRASGDNNPGTINAIRVLGWAPGLVTALYDVSIGVVCVLIAGALGAPTGVTYLAGIAAVVGHRLPVFHGFRGGGQGMGASAGLLLYGIATAGAVHPEDGGGGQRLVLRFFDAAGNGRDAYP